MPEATGMAGIAGIAGMAGIAAGLASPEADKENVEPRRKSGRPRGSSSTTSPRAQQLEGARLAKKARADGTSHCP
ncbi:hypothetical protein NFJ02_14g19310 [Pycnococcus provasolii]